jgi:hypothetical protein
MGPDQASRPRPTGAAHCRIPGDLRGESGRPVRWRPRGGYSDYLRVDGHAPHDDGGSTVRVRDHAESHLHQFRIYTDGRGFPKGEEATWSGYSIGKWLDTDSDGRFDALEVETRNFKGPRVYEASGIPLHSDNESIVHERITLDKQNNDLLRYEITTVDHALTRPWTVLKTFRREHNVLWSEDQCSENNNHVVVGKEFYFLSGDGYLMPTRKDQPPPDTRYFRTGR